MKTKMFATVLAMLMLLTAVVISPASAADEVDGVVVKGAQVVVPHGATEAEVTVSVTGIPSEGLVTAFFNTRVDGAVITSGTAVEGLTGHNVVGPTADAAKGVNFMWASDTAAKEDTAFVTFKVAIPADAACGTSYDVIVTPSEDPDDFLTGDNAAAVAVSAQNGKIVVGHELEHTDGVPATCTEAGTVEYWHCSICDKKFADAEAATEIEDIVAPATGHALTHVEAVEPTTEKDGNIEYWTCSNCNKVFSDAEGKTEIKLEDTVVKYEKPFTPGDADGNGKVNAKDIIAVMRHMLGNTPENFIEEAADMDGNDKINAKDIIAIMRTMLGAK